MCRHAKRTKKTQQLKSTKNNSNWIRINIHSSHLKYFGFSISFQSYIHARAQLDFLPICCLTDWLTDWLYVCLHLPTMLKLCRDNILRVGVQARARMCTYMRLFLLNFTSCVCVCVVCWVAMERYFTLFYFSFINNKISFENRWRTWAQNGKISKLKMTWMGFLVCVCAFYIELRLVRMMFGSTELNAAKYENENTRK